MNRKPDHSSFNSLSFVLLILQSLTNYFSWKAKNYGCWFHRSNKLKTKERRTWQYLASCLIRSHSLAQSYFQINRFFHFSLYFTLKCYGSRAPYALILELLTPYRQPLKSPLHTKIQDQLTIKMKEWIEKKENLKQKIRNIRVFVYFFS